MASRTASAVPGQSGTILDSECVIVIHAGQVEQHRESGRALDERADRRAAKSDDQIAFPVPRDRSVGGLRRSLADQDLGAHEALAAPTTASRWHAQCSPGAQARGQLASQGPSTLDVQGLVDGFVRDPHGIIVGILDREPIGDLLRTPRVRPASVLARTAAAARPGAHFRAGDSAPVLGHDLAREPLLHVAS
jgi:hypothetical protein